MACVAENMANSNEQNADDRVGIISRQGERIVKEALEVGSKAALHFFRVVLLSISEHVYLRSTYKLWHS